ncbi:mCG147080 [Mus musculus]|nr:mCG147080 [Mus musculus]
MYTTNRRYIYISGVELRLLCGKHKETHHAGFSFLFFSFLFFSFLFFSFLSFFLFFFQPQMKFPINQEFYWLVHSCCYPNQK